MTWVGFTSVVAVGGAVPVAAACRWPVLLAGSYRQFMDERPTGICMMGRAVYGRASLVCARNVSDWLTH